ncbi:AraC family transcriptional regulator ligand-binding domain-containing protein [Sulfitobacter sp. G21635-S1]|uniref:AraC family transcriptional regulator n=1 Tax=Sulfitobacter sp. G21635-S1 TaxID=3014043 RepID=UPI0022AE6E3E|nr:AraC family transcriptional regulator [Sulfitobacter sp. G21635-S1]MCZ4255400.1 AraC family transcriptional regulator ligand-binding domain-containing protein [Sulfitobacter sp. G21635-S1]
MSSHDPISLTTVSAGFIQDWLDALNARCTPDAMTSLLQRSGLQTGPMAPAQRVTLEEIARLYQLAAPETGDEMMGLWSRPIRPRALQHLLTVQREARSLVSALFRFTTFWNLLLDDFRLELRSNPEEVELALVPYLRETAPQRFGHMLILKLAHGLLSWLSGSETGVKVVRFAFSRPDFAADYAVVFPCPVAFEAAQTSILFDPRQFASPIARSPAEASVFLERAPLDWIFTGSRAHTNSLRVRAFLYGAAWQSCQLLEAAQALKMTPRTLNRRLKEEGTSFQNIKDALRRDIAIRALQQGTESIEQIAFDTGFSAPANFHRAFRKWTSRTPGSYRL